MNGTGQATKRRDNKMKVFIAGGDGYLGWPTAMNLSAGVIFGYSRNISENRRLVTTATIKRN